MYFTTNSLLPENQEPLIITAAPVELEWSPIGNSEDLAVSWDTQVQKAVDCYNAGATLLSVRVREPRTARGPKSFNVLNDMVGRLRNAVPKMVFQISGSISYRPPEDHLKAMWMGYDAWHLLAELDAKPDQITVVFGSTRMNTTDDLIGARPEAFGRRSAYRKILADARHEFYLEHLKRLRGNNIQPFFTWSHTNGFKEAEHLIRSGAYMGPLNHNLMVTGGSSETGRIHADFREYVRRSPQGSVPFIESWTQTVPQFGIMAIVLGIHIRVGIEGNFRNKKGARMTSVEQIEQTVQVSEELGRKVATADEARKILKIGVWYNSINETLAGLGLAPNWDGTELGVIVKKSHEKPKARIEGSVDSPWLSRPQRRRRMNWRETSGKHLVNAFRFSSRGEATGINPGEGS